MTLTAKRLNINAYQILNGGTLVALAFKLASGLWGQYDKSGTRMSHVTFKTPQDAAEAWRWARSGRDA